jgi:hypothetical protein
MKLYSCDHCYNSLYFEDNTCQHCNYIVGFDVSQLVIITLMKNDEDIFVDVNNRNKKYRFCENNAKGTCNWLIPAEEKITFCKACELNRTIPVLSTQQNIDRWKKIEVAKHRLVYSLFRLQLPVSSKEEDDSPEGIAFDFMADVSPDKKVITGHENGAITLNIEEADDTIRIKHQHDLGERYRTLLGHFRHEIAHYYWDILIKDNPAGLKKCREVFGDDQKDYTQSLEAYYKTGAPVNWSDHFISPYATAHPWEDWAETWAHYMHLMDTLETAFCFGIAIHPVRRDQVVVNTDINLDPYSLADFDTIFNMWVSFTFATNSLNRSMGYNDFYPFVISIAVKVKLQFIHDICKLKLS